MPQGFDPNDRGIEEQAWREFLGAREEWQPNCPHLLVVAPHPEDEILGAGGLMRACTMQASQVTVLSVTDGEAADPSQADLGVVRRQELREALRRLSRLHVRVERLGLRDGSVAQHANRLHDAILSLCDSGTTLVAPYEHDGHPDHDAAGSISLKLARDRAIPLLRYPIWAWHHTDPQSLQPLRWLRFPLSPDTQRAKRRAIQCFDSRLRSRRGPPVVPAHVLTHFDRPYEAFIA